MPNLTDYLVASMNQGKVLSGDYALKKDVQGGICAALCNVFLLLFMDGKASGDPNAILAAVRKEFNIAINKQRIWKDAYSQSKSDRITTWNSVSSITRLHFTLADQGKALEPFKKQLPLLGSGAYFISIAFASNKGAHMLTMLKVDADLVLFDPNIGLFEVPGADVEQFSSLFFGAYKAAGYDLDDWLIGQATQAKSARERMMEALNKLT